MVGDLEPMITSVTVIPGATEFGYDPTPRVQLLGRGVTAPENTNQSATVSDWTLSIDELVALCPNLTNVSLVVAWFGDDLRCGTCTIAPKVEAASRTIKGTSWEVAGISRGSAGVVSTHDGGPAYGGTPSDNAVLAAIADLKARGLGVTLYPIVLMDIPEGNPLGQPAYPWRGRIACQPGSTGPARRRPRSRRSPRLSQLHPALRAAGGRRWRGRRDPARLRDARHDDDAGTEPQLSVRRRAGDARR